MDFKNICINCMKEKAEGESVCQHCGFDSQTYVIPQYVLPPYTILGITYMALDLMLEHPVAIKEYFIQNIMYRNVTESSHVTIACSDIPKEKIYKISREKFENEAKTLASLSDLPGIVRVLDFFTEFNTAYIVMEYLSGMTLKEYVKEQGGKLSVKETREKLNPIMTSLQYVHDRNIIHRDISPDNMKVLDKGIGIGTVKLFDFGGAGQEIRSEDDPKSAIVLKKDGYTPIEQIAGASNQGAWTDVYAMAATIYFCICGQPPLSANARVAEPDKFKTPTQLGVPIGKKVEEVLLKGMTIQTGERYQTMKEFQDALEKAGWGEDLEIKSKIWPFVVGACFSLTVGAVIFIHQARNINKEPDTFYEYDAGNLMDGSHRIEAVTEAVTELAATKAEKETEAVKEAATEVETEAETETETEAVTETVTEAATEEATEELTETEKALVIATAQSTATTTAVNTALKTAQDTATTTAVATALKTAQDTATTTAVATALKTAQDTATSAAKTTASKVASEVGNQVKKEATKKISSQMKTLNNGLNQLTNGLSTLDNGAQALKDGANKLDEGAKTLSTGIKTFNEEGIKKICNLINGQLKDKVDRVKKLKELSEEYNNFTMLDKENDGNVKFIMIIDSIKKQEEAKQDVVIENKQEN